MAGQAAFDMVLKELVPSQANAKEDSSCPEEESPGPKKLSLNWRPTVSDLAMMAEEEEEPPNPSVSWASLAKVEDKIDLGGSRR